MNSVSYILLLQLIALSAIKGTLLANNQNHDEHTNKISKVHFILDINRPGVIPPTAMRDEKTGKDPFGILWTEEAGKLTFIGKLQAKEKGESIKQMELENQIKLTEQDIVLSSTLNENIIEYWENVLSTLFGEKKQIEVEQLTQDNKIKKTSKDNFILHKFNEKVINNGFLINSKTCLNVFKESKLLFTTENIDKFYEKYPLLYGSAISIENLMHGKKFKAVYNGNSIFKLEIKKNDLIYNPNLLKRMITYYEADLYKKSKLSLLDEDNTLKLRRKIVEYFDLNDDLDELIAKSFINYVINDQVDNLREIKNFEDNSAKYFAITTNDFNMIAFRKFWNRTFSSSKLKNIYPKFNSSYSFIFVGDLDKILEVHVYEDHILRGIIEYNEFVEKFKSNPEFELSSFNKYCSK